MSNTTQRCKLSAAAAAVVAAGVALPSSGTADEPAAELGKRKAPTVRVADDFFSPRSVTVKPRTKVKFKWSEGNSNPHNVTLTKGPKKAKKGDFQSKTATTGMKFAPKFVKKGSYDFICTIHPGTMKATVKVKK